MLNDEIRSKSYISHRKDGSKLMKSLCRDCEHNLVKAVRKLERTNPRPRPGSECECCGRISRLNLDHCHATGRFRGYLCSDCNTGIGKLGDSKEGILKALVYLMPVKVNVEGAIAQPRRKNGRAFSDASSVSCEKTQVESNEGRSESSCSQLGREAIVSPRATE